MSDIVESDDNTEGVHDLEVNLVLQERPFIKGQDDNFLAHTMATYLKRVGQNTYTSKPLFYTYVRPALNKLMDDLATQKTIFYFDINGAETLVGFTVSKSKHLVFAYIKSTYRGLGLYKKIKHKVANCEYSCFVTPNSTKVIRLPIDSFFFAKEYYAQA